MDFSNLILHSARISPTIEHLTEVPLSQINDDLAQNSKVSLADLENDQYTLQQRLSEIQSKIDSIKSGETSASASEVSNIYQNLQKTMASLSNSIDQQISLGKTLDNQNTNLMSSNMELDSQISTLEQQNSRIKQELSSLGNNTITRQRMLQLSQDKNVYKMKVIYTLVAIILCVIILMLALYSSTK